MLLYILILYLLSNNIAVLTEANDCWDTGCQLDGWAVVGCEQYGRTETKKVRCSGGYVYRCCKNSQHYVAPIASSSSSSYNSDSYVDCWTTGCQLNNWAVTGCDQYQKIEINKSPCTGGYMYECCTRKATGRPTTTARKSTRKCDEYKRFAYNTSSPNSKVSNCAYAFLSKIVAGTEAQRREFPHMALVGYILPDENDIQWLCGGSLISSRFVLSAAHCENQYNAKVIRLGEHELERDSDAAPIDIDVVDRIPHPKYQRSTNKNDILLYKLSRVVNFNHAIRPACLSEYPVSSGKAIATGWGSYDFEGHMGTALMKVQLDIFPYEQCKNSKISEIVGGIDETSHLCAGSYTDQRDTCKGDSGGPLQIYHDTHHCMYTIIGVISMGYRCGNQNSPGVYTRVSNYLDFIESNVWPNE